MFHEHQDKNPFFCNVIKGKQEQISKKTNPTANPKKPSDCLKRPYTKALQNAYQVEIISMLTVIYKWDSKNHFNGFQERKLL